MSGQVKRTCMALGVCNCPTDICDTAQAYAVLARYRQMEGQNLPIPDPNAKPMESLVDEIGTWILIALLSVVTVIAICGVAGYFYGARQWL